jgi:Flp pilus assembly protein CpaB
VQLARQVAAGALACLALVLALRPAPPAGATPAQPTVPVVVAASDLRAGAVLTSDDLRVTRLPAEVAPSGVADVVETLIGQVLAAPVRAGEAVTDVRVVGPGLWSQVPDGLVATPVRLADLAVATLLRAGDRVDVLAASSGPDGTTAVEVVAEGALVLTVPAGDQPPTTDSGNGLLVLAVTPATAQQLAASGAAGTLTVTLGRP